MASNTETNLKEGVWTYHITKSNHSYRSTDCEGKLIRLMFDQPKFHLARTKCEAIAKNIFETEIKREIKTELQGVNFVSIATDASNHKSDKIFPVVICKLL